MDNAEVLVKFKGDDSDVKEKANGLGNTLSKAAKVGGASLAAIGTAAAATTKALISGANATAQYGDAIDKNSQKVGLSTKAYQEWDYAMQISGTSMENCAVGLKTLTNKVDDLKNGSSSATETFDKLGISLADVEGKSREEVFSQVVSGLQNITDEAEKAAIANDLFGRSGQELLPMFNLTNEETQKLIEEANEYGMVMSSEAVDASAAFQDSLTRMQGTIAGVKNGILSGLLPGFTDVTDGIAMLVNGADGAEDKIVDGVEKLINNIEKALPKIIKILTKLIPKLVPVVINVIKSVANILMENMPMILEAGVSIILQLITGISQMMPTLIPCIIDCILTIIQAILDNMDLIIDGGIQLVLGIIEGIMNSLPILMQKAPQIIVSVVVALVKALPKVMTFGVQFIGAMLNGILSTIGAIPKAILGVFNKVWDGLKSIANGIKQMFSNIFSAIANIVKAPINFVIDGINAFIRGLNKIKIPDWVPGVGGKGLHFKEIPKLNVGTNCVPDDTLAMVHKGEAVIPKKFNPYANGVSSQTLGAMTGGMSPVIKVYNDMEIDPLGQVVSTIKTFGGGAKNDYVYGYGGA